VGVENVNMYRYMCFCVFSLSVPCRPYGPFWPILVYTGTLDSMDGCEVILPNMVSKLGSPILPAADTPALMDASD
jgi:hypothetical protein